MAQDTGNRANTGQNLMVIDRSSSRPADRSTRADAAFVAQLLAARENLASQRLRRRASGSEATSAYVATAKSTVRRMPAGYRTSETV